jgi:hypothetical protein
MGTTLEARKHRKKLEHRQNNHKEVRYEDENVILAQDSVQWQALMNTEMIFPVLERWEIS